MSTISTIAVDFIANVSKYLQGLKIVETQTKKTANDASKSFDGISNSAKKTGSSIGSLSRQLNQLRNIAVGGAFASFAKQILDSAGRLQDLSDQLNISTSNLQRFESVFQKSGNTLEDVSNVFNKLQKSAIDASEGNKSLQDAFTQLGIDANSFIQLSPEDKVERFSRALDGISDPAKRAALAQEVLGKSSAKVLNALQDIAASGGIKKATDSIFVNSEEAIAALDRLGDSATSTFTTITRAAIEFAGQVVLATQQLMNLQKNAPGGSTTGAAFMGQGGLAGAANFRKAIEEAQGRANTGIGDVAQAQQEQALLRQRAAADRERAAALALQAEAFRKVRDSILASIDPAAKYASEVDKINELVKKNRLSEEDRLKLIAGISQAYVFAVDPVKKYAAEVAKINADKGLSEKQKADNIKLLGAAYDDAIDPANRYKKILEDLDALVANGIRTDQERRTVIDSLGSSYRALYDPTEKYLKLQRDLIALPRGSNVNILDVLRNSNKEVRDISRPLAELDDKLKESNAYFEALAKTEVATLQKILQGYEQQGTLTQGRLELLQQEAAAIQAKYQTEATFAALTIKQQKDAIYQREIAIALNDKQLLGEAQYTEDLVRINKLLAASRESEKGAIRLALTDQQKKIMLLQAEAKVFLTRNEAIAQGFQYMSDFADQFSRAIVEGQNFGDALKNVFKSILKDITVLILRTAILQGIMASIGFINPVAGAAFGQLTGLTPRARGGPVAMGGAYRVGEAGPETFVPAQNGYILPNDMQPGESTNVVQNIYVQTGVAQTVRAEMLQLLPRFKSEAMAGVLDARQRGGSYAKGISPV
jgi:hypothetical protein